MGQWNPMFICTIHHGSSSSLYDWRRFIWKKIIFIKNHNLNNIFAQDIFLEAIFLKPKRQNKFFCRERTTLWIPYSSFSVDEYIQRWNEFSKVGCVAMSCSHWGPRCYFLLWAQLASSMNHNTNGVIIRFENQHTLIYVLFGCCNGHCIWDFLQQHGSCELQACVFSLFYACVENGLSCFDINNI